MANEFVILPDRLAMNPKRSRVNCQSLVCDHKATRNVILLPSAVSAMASSIDAFLSLGRQFWKRNVENHAVLGQSLDSLPFQTVSGFPFPESFTREAGFMLL